jgi:GBP family porin
MQKKALVMALGAAFVIQGAFAQKAKGSGDADSVVELYGKVYPELVFPSSSGATAAGATVCTICQPAVGSNAIIKRTEMESSNSRFGIRGHEKLGRGLKAIFQMETEFHVDSNDSRFAQRDSFVGLSNDGWGTVKLGRMDTPFKEYGDDLSFLGVSSGNFTSTSGIFRHIGFGGQNNAARFHERRVNVVQYESPDWGPVDFKVQWSTNETKTATRDPRVLSMGGKYEMGPFSILLAHEIHYDLFGLSLNVPSAMRNSNDPNVRSKDQASSIAFKYNIGVHQFEVDANRKKYDEPTSTAGRVRAYQNNAYEFIWEARWSQQWRTAFHYVKATAGKCSVVDMDCNTGGLEGTQMSIGFAYHFSRRTYLFVMGTLVRNGYSAVYNNSNQQAPNPGEDIRQIGVGLHTSF